jgi:hypothetical protein
MPTLSADAVGKVGDAMNRTRALQVMAWVGESVSLAAIGEYCSIMDSGERGTATAQVVTGTLEDLGRERVREAKETLGIK